VLDHNKLYSRMRRGVGANTLVGSVRPIRRPPGPTR
jgi:hypothetical protein